MLLAANTETKLPASAGPPGSFSPELQVWVEDGVRVGLPDMEFWSLCRRGTALISLSGVPDSRRGATTDTAVLGVMQGVLCATAATRFGDCDFLAHEGVGCGKFKIGAAGALGVQNSRRPNFEFSTPDPADGAQRLADFAAELSHEYEERLRRLPRHAEFAELLRYDRQRLFNTLRNARGVHQGEAFLHRVTGDPLFAAGLHVLTTVMLDVTGSPNFDPGELSLLREALRTAEYRFREESFLTHWERRGESTSTDDRSAARERWRRCHDELQEIQRRLRSVDLGRFVAGLETLAGWPGDEDDATE